MVAGIFYYMADTAIRKISRIHIQLHGDVDVGENSAEQTWSQTTLMSPFVHRQYMFAR